MRLPLSGRKDAAGLPGQLGPRQRPFEEGCCLPKVTTGDFDTSASPWPQTAWAPTGSDLQHPRCSGSHVEG